MDKEYQQEIHKNIPTLSDNEVIVNWSKIAFHIHVSKVLKFQVLARMQENGNLHVANGRINWYTNLENNLVRSSKSEDRHTLWILLESVALPLVHKETGTGMFTAFMLMFTALLKYWTTRKNLNVNGRKDKL